MAKKTKKEPAKQEVERIDLGNGTVLVKYDDGSVEVVTTTVLTAEQAQQIFGNDSDDDDDDEDDEDEDDSDEDDDDEDDSDDDEVTPEMLAEADFEELEDICDEKELDTDPDDFDEEDVEKLRAAIAKEMGIKLPKGKGKKGKK
jgi:hypothetical protein